MKNVGTITFCLILLCLFSVRPGGRLKITPGVTLKFEHGVGMMVSGEIIAEGDLQGGQPVFTLLDTVRENVSSVPVRLMGGKTVREGRLQVELSEGEWGTVCNFGWTIESAALACQQVLMVTRTLFDFLLFLVKNLTCSRERIDVPSSRTMCTESRRTLHCFATQLSPSCIGLVK